jgi:hypothetical protein
MHGQLRAAERPCRRDDHERGERKPTRDEGACTRAVPVAGHEFTGACSERSFRTDVSRALRVLDARRVGYALVPV